MELDTPLPCGMTDYQQTFTITTQYINHVSQNYMHNIQLKKNDANNQLLLSKQFILHQQFKPIKLDFFVLIH